MKRLWAVPSLALAAFLAVSVVPAGAQTASGTTVSIPSDATEASGTPAPVSVTSNLKLFPSLPAQPKPAASSSGDSFHRFDFFVGYSFLNNNAGFVNDENGPAQLVHGYAGSVTFNLNKNFGILADFSGHNGSLNLTGSPAFGTVDQDEDQYYYLFGPTVSHSIGKARISGHVTVGVARTHVNDTFSGGGFESIKETNFAAGVGGAFDWMFSDRFGWRVLQFDYLTNLLYNGNTFNSSGRLNNVRASTGLVFHFK